MKTLLSPMPAAATALHQHLVATQHEQTYRSAQLLRQYEAYVKKHRHPARHEQANKLLKRAGKASMRAELAKLALATLEHPELQVEATNGAAERAKVKL